MENPHRSGMKGPDSISNEACALLAAGDDPVRQFIGGRRTGR